MPKKTSVYSNHFRVLSLMLVVLGVASIGVYVLSASHAASLFGSSETENGSLSGGASITTDATASGGKAITFGQPSVTPINQPLLGALAPSASPSDLYAAGFREIVIAVNWSSIEPSEGSYSASAISSLQSQITSDKAAGLSTSLDIGVQYAPSWIFTVGGGTQFIDQYGDVFTGSAESGNYVPNAVTDMNVRSQVGDYLAYLGSHLTGLDAVRLGGEAYNEMRYPSGNAGSQSNAFWFYDSSSQATLPASVQGWKPGTGTSAQATTFLNSYNAAMVNYGVWLSQQGTTDFPRSKIEMLLPGWGERPSEIGPAESGLLSGTPDEINQGLDWADLLPKLSNSGQVVAYSTWGDATYGDSGNPDPAAYIHSILPNGMLAGAESTGNGQTTATGENLMFTDAKQWNWYVVNWFFNGQSQTPAQLDQAFAAD